MKMVSIFILIIMLVLLVDCVLAVNFFSEGFESGDFAGWTAWGSPGGWDATIDDPRTGAWSAHANNVNTLAYMGQNMTTFGYKNVNVSIWWKQSTILEAGEFLSAEYFNGTDYVIIFNTSDNDGYVFNFTNLGSDNDDNMDFGLRFICLNNNPAEDCYIDDINLTGETLDDSNYTFFVNSTETVAFGWQNSTRTNLLFGNDYIRLNDRSFGNSDGTFLSNVYNISNSTFNNITIQTDAFGELPDSSVNETRWVSDNLNFLNNTLLFHMNEVSGEVNDFSDGGNNGTPNGTLVYGVDGQVGNAIYFDGVQSRLQIDNKSNLEPTDEITFGSWIQRNGSQATFAKIMFYEPLGAFNDPFGPWGMEFSNTDDDDVRCHVANTTVGSNTEVATTTSLVGDGEWHSVICRLKDNVLSIWFDGVRMANASHTVGIGDYGGLGLGLGCVYSGNATGQTCFNGSIDEAFVIPEGIVDAEILSIYERGARDLNVSYRTCNDAACAGESFTFLNNTFPFQNLDLSNNTFFQYNMTFSTDVNSTTLTSPKVYNVTIGYEQVPGVPPPPPFDFYRLNDINDITSGGGNIFVGTGSNVTILNSSFNLSKTYTTAVYNGTSNNVTALSLDFNNNEMLYIGTYGWGISRVDTTDDSLNASWTTPFILSNNITSSSFGSLLVGTNEGAFLIGEEIIVIPPPPPLLPVNVSSELGIEWVKLNWSTVNNSNFTTYFIDTFGEMWEYNANATPRTFAVAAPDVYYNFTGLGPGELNRVNYTNETQANGGSFFTVTEAGLYELHFDMSFAADGSGLYGIGIVHDFDVNTHRNCYTRKSIEKKNVVGSVSVGCIMDVVVGDNINIQIEDEAVGRDIFIHTANLNIIKII